MIPVKRLIGKLIGCAITLFLVMTLNFLLFRVLPGDPVRMLFRDPRITPEMLAGMRQLFGLDKPLYVQYYLYLVNLFHGELGTSFVYRSPVLGIVVERLWNTIFIVGLSQVLAILVGSAIGLLAARRHGSRLDTACQSLSLTLYSIPNFWLSMIFILVFAVYLGVFPSSGMSSLGVHFSDPFAYLWDLARHLVLPVTCLTLYEMGIYTLILRSSLLDAFGEDYILTARAKGLSDWQIIREHALQNAILPTLTVAAIQLGTVVGGALQIETVFAWPGIGRLMYDSLLLRDYPVLQGAFLITAVSVILANFLVDIIYTLLDPRVRY